MAMIHDALVSCICIKAMTAGPLRISGRIEAMRGGYSGISL